MRTLPCHVSSVLYPAFVRSRLRGFSCARRQLALLLLRLPEKSFAKNAQNISPDPPQMQSFGTREHGPLAFFVTRSSSGNSTDGDSIMYQNNITLIGFLGANAEVRTATN